MFRQDHQSTVALTLEYTHSYDIFHVTGPTTTSSSWQCQINSIKKLRKEFCDRKDEVDELQEKLDKTGEKNLQHISIKVNGLINGEKITDLQIDGLDNFRNFIVNRQPNNFESTPQNRP